MSRNKAIALGICTVIPILYVFVFISFFLFAFNSSSFESRAHDLIFKIIFPIHFAVMLLLLGNLIICIKDVFSNEHIESDKRSLWAIVLFFGNVIAMPVYWYINIWKYTRKMIR